MTTSHPYKTIRIKLPISLDLSTRLLQVIGAAWPSTIIDTTTGETDTLVLRVDAAEIDNPNTTPPVDEQHLNEATGTLLSSLEDGTFGCRAPEYATRLFAGLAEQILADSDAENYLEMAATHPDNGTTYRFVICKPNQPSPHELRKQAEARIAALETELAALRNNN